MIDIKWHIKIGKGNDQSYVLKQAECRNSITNPKSRREETLKMRAEVNRVIDNKGMI